MRQKLGQHFLVKGSILERIARAACPERTPLLIEIGPGKGALTDHLIERADFVIGIEFDEDLAAYLREKYRESSKFTVIGGDVLEVDLGQWGPAVIAGNLPYYIATPILEKALRLGAAMQKGVFLIQREVADRLVAEPGCREYGYLTVSAKLWADIELLFTVKPSAFHPPPQVDSALIRVTPRDRVAELGIDSPDKFLRFVSVCFRQKRKTIRNNLGAAYDKAQIDGWPESSLRAEQLTLLQFAHMYRRLVP